MIAFLLLLSAPTPEAQKLAQQSFVEAEAAFARREFAAAAAAFEQAARAVPHPAPWLNAAEAWEKAGANDRAAEDCEQALAVPEAGAVHRQAAQSCLERHGPRLALLEVLGPSTGTARIADRTTDLPARRWLRPGDYVLQLEDRASGARHEEVLTVVAAQRVARTLIPTPPPPPPVLTQTPTASPALTAASPGPGIASWAAFGVAGGATIGTAILGALTISAQNNFEAAPSQDAADTFYGRRTGTNVALAVAIGAAGAGLLFWALEL